MAFSPKGDLLATASTDRTVKVWDMITVRNYHLRKVPKRLKTTRVSMAFSPQQDYPLQSTADGTVTVWDVKEKQKCFSVIGT